jgi:PAS domain-containing protein
MEVCFITIHGRLLLPVGRGHTYDKLELSLDARIKYVSDSVEDILGYLPYEVKGKSCWEYFHPDEIPFARAVHGRGIDLDKAASLNYCQIKHKDGSWVGCECVFTVVYDVLVACTSIYRRGPRSQSEYSSAMLVYMKLMAL